MTATFGSIATIPRGCLRSSTRRSLALITRAAPITTPPPSRPSSRSSARRAAPFPSRHVGPKWPCMAADDDLKRLSWRAHHRGTREADMLIGGFFDAHHARWSANDRALFSEMLDEQDADIMAWAIGTAPPPERFAGPLIEALQRLDYIRVPR